MDKDLEQRRSKFIECIQAMTEVNTGIKPSREQVGSHVGKPGELKPGSPPWMKPLEADHIVRQN